MKTLREVREGFDLVPLPHMIERTVKNHPNSIAMKILTPEGFKEWSYLELFELIRTRAEELREMDIKKGDRVALFGPNSPEWVITYLAIQWIGCIGVPLDSRLSYREVQYLLNDSGAKTLYASPDGVSEAIEISIPMKIPETIVDTERIPKPDITLDDPAVILYTSGTTGSSKGVVLTHRNLISNVDMCYRTIYYKVDEPFYVLLPLHHVFSQTICMLGPLYAGATMLFARSFKSSEIKEDCHEGKPVAFPVVPLILEKFVEGIQRELKKLGTTKKIAFGLLNGLGSLLNSVKKGSGGKFYSTIRNSLGMDNLRYLISGGAALPGWVSETLEKWGFPLIQGYGLTETSPVVSVNPPESARNASVGQILPGLEVKILNPGEDGIGEIAVKGPSVFKEYWNNPKATEEKFEGDWFKTGDMGYLDKDYFLYVTGRKKSVIVTKGGKNIYPEEIETYLSRSPLIEEILVLHQTNPTTGNKELIAMIYPNYEEIDLYCRKHEIDEKEPHKILMMEIRKLNRDLADYKRIRRIKLRDEEFPKTTTEKIKRYLFEEEGVEI